MPRSESTSEFLPMEQKEVEYFFASDASAVIEHTNRVIYLEVSGRISKKIDNETDNGTEEKLKTLGNLRSCS